MNVLLSGLSVDRIENHTLAALHDAGVRLFAILGFPASSKYFEVFGQTLYFSLT